MRIEVDNPNDVGMVLDVKVYDEGLWAVHNYPCPVCLESKAVLQLSTGLMQPCWGCMNKNYRIVKLTKFGRLLERLR